MKNPSFDCIVNHSKSRSFFFLFFFWEGTFSPPLRKPFPLLPLTSPSATLWGLIEQAVNDSKGFYQEVQHMDGRQRHRAPNFPAWLTRMKECGVDYMIAGMPETLQPTSCQEKAHSNSCDVRMCTGWDRRASYYWLPSVRGAFMLVRGGALLAGIFNVLGFIIEGPKLALHMRVISVW